MSYEYGYALEKFSRAIYSLATGEDDVRKRLLLIFEDDLLMITAEHLPLAVRSEYQSILREATKFDEKYAGQKQYLTTDDGRYDHLIPSRFEATLHRVRKKTGARMARKILHIWSVLEEESRA